MTSESPHEVSPQPTQSDWIDAKRYLWLLSPALPVIGVGAMIIYRVVPKKMRGLAWIGPIAIHVVIPILDRIIGEDKNNPPEEIVAKLERDPYYATIVKAFIPLQYLALFIGAYLYTRKETPAFDKLGIAISVGALNGIAITNAHENSHKSDKFNQIMSHLVLAPTAYGHFRVEHPYGHHKRVATPEDPASAQMGESFWRFLPRTVIGSFKSAIEIEKNRLARRGKTFWCLENELLQGWAMTAGLYSTLVAIFGRKVIPFIAIQAVYGFSLLEVINYVEHYGLLRAKQNGKYERTKPEHSWNSNKIVTNLFLYQLQRHSDHHAHPTRSFQALRHFEDAPQLPSGYATMILPAYIPALWFRMMDKRVVEHYKGDLSKANILPAKRRALMKKYGGANRLTSTHH
ncbi:alkane 1-monooxygenase [Aquirhabdus parva]|uniref:Alkane 1-monooxygenase n=1 Tax=Aquirhabdus parva TaxID=2283318 RepID=A0A345PBS5_9GAMM|nr:alkane 1-monooxygenase [Aquirhabdus parva]AXI04734.1 alkane 1-monooxygenase [Aquirhabdus parva]